MKESRRERVLPRVQRIELSEKNVRLRWILAGVLLVIGLAAIAFGVNSCVQTQLGWQQVQASAGSTNCSGDFVLQYCYGQGGVEPTLERQQVVTCYSEAVVEAWELFNTDVEGSKLGNLSAINASPNQPVTVEAALYQALKTLVEAESRYLYLAPLYTEYSSVFYAESEILAQEYDPSRNPELGAYARQVAAFAADPAHISLVLQEENRVTLQVSQEYLAFAEEYGIADLVDFGWMKNAFIADFLAQKLIDAGHTNGYLVSYDGFTRNLDTRGDAYSFNLFDRMGNDIYIAGVWEYEAPVSILFLRDYPLSSVDGGDYYLYADGTTTHRMLDIADGMCKAATENLVCYSKYATCGQLAVAAAPLFIAQQLDTEALNSLTQKGIFSIWFDGSDLLYNESTAAITVKPPEGTAYQKKFSEMK